MNKLVIPQRYLLKVEYPQVFQERYEFEEGFLSVPSIKRLTPLKILVWSPSELTSDVGYQSAKIQTRAFNAMMGSETFALVLAPGTINEVRYPRVIITVLRPTRHVDAGPGCSGPATEMEFHILQIPGTETKEQTKEDAVKVFEAIVVKLDAQGEAEAVSQAATLIVAKNVNTAKESVLVDFAQDRHLSGKDLAGYSVRIREFQSAV